MPDEYDFIEAETKKDRHAWRDYAACLDTGDDRIIFPWGLDPPEPPETRQWIANHCDVCPVRQRCLDFALDTESLGIWGGVELTPTRVQHLRRLREQQGSLTVDQVKEASRRSKQ